MAIIGNSDLQTILDKLARFASESVGDPEFNNAFNAGMATASADVLSGSGGIATFLLTLNSEDVEADMLPAARILDETHPVPPDGFLLGITSVNNMIKAIDTHFKTFGYKGLDDYLTHQNASAPTLRAHGHFKKYLKTLSPGNAFIPVDQTVASIAITAAAAGTYSHGTAIDKTVYAGAKLVAKNNGALTSSAVLSITGKKLDGTTATLTVTLSTHTDAHETDLSDATKVFVDVTAITVTSGGTSGDHVNIVAKSDRSVAAA